MLSSTEQITLRGTVREVLALSKRAKSAVSLDQAERAVHFASADDYCRQVRRLFDRRQAREIVGQFSRSLPGLNREIMHDSDPGALAGIADRLGARLTAMPFEARTRGGLRGFYLRPIEGIKRPLICVNAATHPVAMASCFWHELGHHLRARLFDDRRRDVDFSFDSNYDRHLEDQGETAADMVSVLAAYPKPMAMRLFSPWFRSSSAPDIDALISRVRPHIYAVSGFRFDGRYSTAQNLRWLTAMIHFGNLRWALLSQFGI